MFAEGFYATQFFPYAAFMAEEMRGSDQNIGFYSGLIFTAVSCGSLVSAVQWAKLSNRIGRRNCLIISLSVSAVMTVLLSCLVSYWLVVGMRFVTGVLNCNLPIMRTALRESFQMWREEDTWAFSTIQVAFGAACVAGPSLGGLLYGRGTAQVGLPPWAPPTLIATGLYVMALICTACYLSDATDGTGTLRSRSLASKAVLRSATSSVASPSLLKDATFVLLLVMGGGHSFIFTGWEIGFPLVARLKHEVSGEQWSTAHIGVTFLIGSFGLMFFSLCLYPKLVKRYAKTTVWIWSWLPALVTMPLTPRLLTWVCDAASAERPSPVLLAALNYIPQMVMSVCLGTCFISVQLLVNSYATTLPDGDKLLAVANSWMASMQAFVRAISPMVTGSLFSTGLEGEKHGMFFVSRNLPFDVLGCLGFLSGVCAAIAFARRSSS